jgi:hypothetical protein
MKTKDKYKKSLSRIVPDQTPTARPRAAAVRPEFRRIVFRYEHEGLSEGWVDPSLDFSPTLFDWLRGCEK